MLLQPFYYYATLFSTFELGDLNLPSFQSLRQPCDDGNPPCARPVATLILCKEKFALLKRVASDEVLVSEAA